MENIRRAKETLEFLYTLDARHLCILKAGTDLFDAAPIIFGEAGKLNIKVNSDSIELINHLRTENPKRIRGRHILEDIAVYLRDDGELYFG
jgi:Tfx family DNA-binding protein